MFIRLYGTRGSVPVSNQATSKYGGNTTCLYLESRLGDSIIVDAGSGIRELGTYLLKNRKNKLSLIFTHYHWDHIQGIPFFVPLYQKNTVVNMYGSEKEAATKKVLLHQMTRPYFPTITWLDVPAKIYYRRLKERFKIGSIRVQTIANNHPNYTVGLKFSEGATSIAFLTDNELFATSGQTPYMIFVNFLKKVDLLIHDAQYTDEGYRIGWGHSTYNQVVKLAQDAKIKNIMFTHHDPFLGTDKAIDGVVKRLRKKYPGYNIQAAAEGKTIYFK